LDRTNEKNNFIIITGGPGGGKSTLLAALEEKGYQHVGESARIIIKERLDSGLSPRPEPAEFAKLLFHMDYENYINNLNHSEILFFDRSFLDSAGMVYETDIAYYRRIRELIISHKYCNKVFITPPWEEIYTNDTERDQTFEQSEIIYNNIYNWYMLNGYEPVVIPKDTVEKRVEFILSEI
jgi:predicted ATPase